MTVSTRARVAVARGLSGALRLARGPWRGNVVTARRRGVTWRLDLTEGIDLYIYLFGMFEPEVVRAYSRIVRPGHTVLDVGANVGAHTLPLARRVGPTGRVVAFEPTVFALEKLRANLGLNPSLASRVTVEQAMLVGSGDEQLPSHLYSSWPVKGGDAVHPLHRGRPEATERARAVTMDRYVAETGLDAVDLVKIDVDGYEDQVLLGAAETIARFRPPILLELAPYLYDGTTHSFSAIIDFLRDHGYALRPLRRRGSLPLDAERLGDEIGQGRSLNALCTPDR